MNDLGIALVWLALQVTAVALIGLGLTTLAARRAPGAGAVAALTALAATVVLAVMACCPLPPWWAWDVSAPPADAAPGEVATAQASEAPAERPAAAQQSSPGGGLRLADLLSALGSLRQSPTSATPADGSAWRWPGVVAAVALAGTTLGLLRLLLGLWAVRRGCHRSAPLEEPDLLRLVEELQAALGVKRPVSVREAADLTTAATVGWRRPVLLLPSDWRSWTPEQQRAVLAHELAHVGRGDFAAWLLARLSVALHFWHPLVCVLAGRLQLQQELAADADAARLVGGRPAYLRTLAELALRADGRANRWPAPAFLSHKGTLLRRVEMLRVKDDGSPRSASRTGRRLLIVLFFALTLVASAVRGPVREALAAAPAGPAKPAEEEVAPFDLSLLGQNGDPDVSGVFGIRPAALLKRPGMAPLLRLLNAQIDALTTGLVEGGVGIHAEDVEQIMGRVYFKGENKTGKRTLMFSLNVLRTTRDVDWAKLCDRYGSRLKLHHWKGQVYVSFALPPMFRGLTGVLTGEGCLWTPDARTLVFEEEKIIKAQIEAQAGRRKPTAPAYAAGWDRVSRGLFAVALDNRGRRLLKRTMTDAEMKEALADPKTPEYHLARFYQNVSGMVVGCAGGDDFRFDLRASADTPEAAAAMVRDCEALLVEARKAVRQAKAQTAAPDQVEAAALRFARKVLKGVAVRRDGTAVTVHAGAASGLDALLAVYAKEVTQGH